MAGAEAALSILEDEKSTALLAHLQRIAPSQANVLLIGETGTGKELTARYIHAHSRQSAGPFVAVNCAAITESLAEAELFGQEKGAFTGALRQQPGWFEVAHRGTLFLDEIGELSLGLQAKLLRVLQQREVVRLGSKTAIPIDVRIIAATNVDLAAAIRAGTFRADLYYRLNVAGVELAPLRERPADIAALSQHFLRRYQSAPGLAAARLSPEAAEKLRQHSWPGNIRELENVIQHGLLLSRSGWIQPEDLLLGALDLRQPSAAGPHRAGTHDAEPILAEPVLAEPLQQALLAMLSHGGTDVYAQVEQTLLRLAYSFCHGNQVQTAGILGLSRNVLRAKLIASGELVVKARGRTASQRPLTLAAAHRLRADAPEAGSAGQSRPPLPGNAESRRAPDPPRSP